MTCGCTDKKLNSKRLNLEDMKNMSMDEIIKLYREGYRLENAGPDIVSNIIPEIKSMIVAVPSVQDITGFVYPTPTYGGEVYTLWNNAGSCGWIRLEVGDTDNNIVFNTKNLCANPRTVPLLYKSVSYFTGPIMEAFGRMYTCATTSNDSCSQTACTTETPSCTPGSITSTGAGLITPLPLYTSAVPNPPTNVQVTPGDRQLIFSWTLSNFVDPNYNMGVFDYYISLSGPDGTPPERAGHVMRNVTSYTFSNLTNGATYTFEIRAITRCDIPSSIASKTGVPTGPVTGTIHFTVQTNDGGPRNGFAIYLDGSPTPAGTTDTNGVYDATVSATPSGTPHTYRISKQWYTDKTGGPVTVIAGQTINVSEIMNRQTGTIHFVVTSGGTPLSGATVNVNGTDRGTTDTNGIFDVPGLYMNYSHQYMISKTYFSTASGTVILDSTPKAQAVSMTRQTGTIHFAVTSGGTPLPNVAISVDTVYRGTTLGDGTLDVSNLDMGISHPYTATLTNYNPASRSVLLDTSPKTEMIAMTLSSTTGTIHFVVTSGGSPLGGVSISVDSGTPGFTNSSGVLDVSGLAMDTTHSYTATKVNYNPADGIVLLNTTPKTVSISMTPSTSGTGSIRFHINCAGSPCQGAQIWIVGINKGQTGIDGTLLLTNLPVGGLNYTVKKSGYQDAPGTVIVVEATTTDANPITLTTQVVQAGAGGAEMIVIVGLAIGAIYVATRKSKPLTP